MIRSVTSLSAAALLAVSLTALSGCTAEAPPAATPAANAPAAYKTIKPSANYPLKKCVVSGDTLGGMGGATAIEYQGREVQFCCQDCIGEFMKEPAKYLAQLDAAK